jgi:autotransporter passenger strand-loop-strand repeat protein
MAALSISAGRSFSKEFPRGPKRAGTKRHYGCAIAAEPMGSAQQRFAGFVRHDAARPLTACAPTGRESLMSDNFEHDFLTAGDSSTGAPGVVGTGRSGNRQADPPGFIALSVTAGLQNPPEANAVATAGARGPDAAPGGGGGLFVTAAAVQSGAPVIGGDPAPPTTAFVSHVGSASSPATGQYGGDTGNAARADAGGAGSVVVASGVPPARFLAGAAAAPAAGNVNTSGAATRSASTAAVVSTPSSNVANPILALLTDTGVKADVSANMVGNTLSYAGMLAILQGVAGRGAVSSTEFADLQTLVAHFNVSAGIQVSPYVAAISKALIGGDPANAYWTGGALNSVGLGNLAVGSSAAQLNELIGKWFLGTDLPSPVFYGNTTATYATDNAPLFAPGGVPSVNDVNQGYLGDCYLLASLAEVAQFEPQDISSMFTVNGNGTFGVRFLIGGTPIYVTVNQQLPYYSGSQTLIGNAAQDIWACLVEKAYAELNAEPGATATIPNQPGNDYVLIQGGDGRPITQVTGRALSDYYTGSYSAASWSALGATIVAAVQHGEEVEFGTAGGQTTINGMVAFVGGHMYSVIGYDSANGDFVVRNPWGTESGQYWLTTFETSMAGFYAEQGMLYVASGTPSAATALVVSAGTTNSGAILQPGDTETVLSGGTAAATTVNGGGFLYVSGGGGAIATTVNSGGAEYVSSGGTASGIVLASGGNAVLQSGAVAGGGIAFAGTGGRLEIDGTLMPTATVSGFAAGDTIDLANESFASAGKASLLSGNVLQITGIGGATLALQFNPAQSFSGKGFSLAADGGSGTKLTLTGTAASPAAVVVSSGVVSSGITLPVGATETVLSGGIAVGTIVGSGGSEYVSAGGTASATAVSSGGSEYVSAGGNSFGTVVHNGGTAYVGGMASGMTVSGGAYVSSGGTAISAVVSSGGRINVSAGGIASSTVISSGCSEIISSGGSAFGATMAAGATLTVSSGGSFLGNLAILSGGVLSGTGFGSGTSLTVLQGATARAISISAGASEYVSSGGTASATAVKSGGGEYVSAGGTASGTVVSSGGQAFVLSGGIDRISVVSRGGLEFISSAGTVSGGTIISGGTITVSAGGSVLGGLKISGGTAVVSGSVASGQAVTFAGSGLLALDNLPGFAAVISGFGKGDQIDLGGFTSATSETCGFASAANKTSGTLTVNNGSATVHLNLVGGYTTSNFTLASDNAGGTLVNFH